MKRETPTTYLLGAGAGQVRWIPWHDQFPDVYCWFVKLECLDDYVFKLGVL